MSVCPSIWAPGAKTAGPIGTGETPFDALERWKDAGANRKAIGATWQCANPWKKVVDRVAGQINGQIGLKLCGPMAAIGGQSSFGKRWWRPLGT